MSTTDLAQLPMNTTMILSDLPPSICQEIAQLANPNSMHRLSKERLPEIKASLDTTCKRLKTGITQSTHAESQEMMLMHDALKAAGEVIELLQQHT